MGKSEVQILVASKQPRGSNLTSDFFKRATLTTLVTVCIVHLTAILESPEAMGTPNGLGGSCWPHNWTHWYWIPMLSCHSDFIVPNFKSFVRKRRPNTIQCLVSLTNVKKTSSNLCRLTLDSWVPDHVQAMLSMNFIASDILHFFFKHASKTEISRHLYVGLSLSLSLLRSLGWPAAAAVVVGVA